MDIFIKDFYFQRLHAISHSQGHVCKGDRLCQDKGGGERRDGHEILRIVKQRFSSLPPFPLSPSMPSSLTPSPPLPSSLPLCTHRELTLVPGRVEALLNRTALVSLVSQLHHYIRIRAVGAVRKEGEGRRGEQRVAGGGEYK